MSARRRTSRQHLPMRRHRQDEAPGDRRALRAWMTTSWPPLTSR